MFSLIVSANETAWEGEHYDLDVGRFGEHTNATALATFKSLDDAALRRLEAMPAVFAYETGREKEARVGRVRRLRVRQDRIRIEFEFEKDCPPLSPRKLIEAAWELDINDWEMNRTHWAVKEVDLAEALQEAGVVPKGALLSFACPATPATRSGFVVMPTVFQAPKPEQAVSQIALMMPFDAAFDPVHAAIVAACDSAGRTCLRVDQIWNDSVIAQDVFNLIHGAQIVVVDFTGRNPNVMYETGIAHTLGREVVPLTQSKDDVPFDLRHHRYLLYKNSISGLRALENDLARRIKTLARRAQVQQK